MDDIFSSHLIGQVSKSSPTPLYHQLYSLLKARILDGTLALGLRLPPEEQLADLFKVSRITAKRAMDEGRFDKSVVPVKNLDGSLALDKDEFPRPGTTMESLSNLKTVFNMFWDVPVPSVQRLLVFSEFV